MNLHIGGETPKDKYSPVQYQAVRDAIPQINASDAKKLTQYLADNDLLGGTAGMAAPAAAVASG